MRRIDHKTGVRVNRLFEGFLTEILGASAGGFLPQRSRFSGGFCPVFVD
jgi:hypothetical protein